MNTLDDKSFSNRKVINLIDTFEGTSSIKFNHTQIFLTTNGVVGKLDWHDSNWMVIVVAGKKWNKIVASTSYNCYFSLNHARSLLLSFVPSEWWAAVNMFTISSYFSFSAQLLRCQLFWLYSCIYCIVIVTILYCVR